MKQLPKLLAGEEFICDSGCGTTTPELKDFEYSREEFTDGRVISKTEKVWRSSCCGACVIVYSNLGDSFTDIDDYTAIESQQGSAIVDSKSAVEASTICQRRASEALSNPAISADSRTAVHAALVCAAAEIAGIESKPAEQRADAWISVDERLPNEREMVLVFRPDAHYLPACDPNIDVRAYFGNGVFNGIHTVTHWQPIPAPPADAAIESQRSEGE